MKPSSDSKRERAGGDAEAPGWYPDPAAPGGYGWWTGREWGWPLSRPADRPVPPPSRLATARPRWFARHGWLLWRAVACVSAAGCAAACAMVGICLATGRPLPGATSALMSLSVLMPVVGLIGLVLYGAGVAVLARASAVRSAWALRGAGLAHTAGAGRSARMRAFLLIWRSCLFSLSVAGALVGWASHAAVAWWAQTLPAIMLASEFSLLCALAFYMSRARLAPRQSAD
jgi:hypothetical protein